MCEDDLEHEVPGRHHKALEVGDALDGLHVQAQDDQCGCMMTSVSA